VEGLTILRKNIFILFNGKSDIPPFVSLSVFFPPEMGVRVTTQSLRYLILMMGNGLLIYLLDCLLVGLFANNCLSVTPSYTLKTGT